MAGLFAAAAAAQPAPMRPERAFEAPSYVAPPANYIAGPNATSQVYVFSLPHPMFPPAPAPAGSASLPTEASGPPVGHLILVVHPPAAEVALDGVRLVQRSDLSYAVGVPEGRHAFRVTAKGFEAHERSVEVRRGIGMFLTVRLKPEETGLP